MHGQRQIYLFLMFVIFITALNFCRKAIKRDKELKHQRDDDIKRKIDADIINQKLKFDLLLQQQEMQRQKNIIYRLYEHKDKCFDLNIFGNRPTTDIQLKIEDNKHLIRDENKKVNVYKKDIKENKNSQKPKKHNSFFEPINYLFVLVLIYFVIKAMSDIKQHYKMKSEEVKLEDGRRRYSLQNYAERKNLKVNPATTIYTTINNTDKRNSTSKIFDERRFSGIISEYKNSESGTIIEPGGITLKTIGKKHPLLRRCSVPILSITNTTNLRQTSIDAVTEYDSSPDMKRRVRMIQRH